jgi:hypothetical protein
MSGEYCLRLSLGMSVVGVIDSLISQREGEAERHRLRVIVRSTIVTGKYAILSEYFGVAVHDNLRP